MATVTTQQTTPPQTRHVDTIISARKAQLISAKARNDELYSALTKHAEARSAQKQMSKHVPLPETRRVTKSTSPGKDNVKARVLTSMKETIEDLRVGQERKDKMMKAEDSISNNEEAPGTDAPQKLYNRAVDTKDKARLSSMSGSPTKPISLSERLDTLSAKLVLRESDIKAVASEVLDLELRVDATIKQVTSGLEGELRRISGDILGRQESIDLLLKHHSRRLQQVEDSLAFSLPSQLADMKEAQGMLEAYAKGLQEKVETQTKIVDTQTSNNQKLARDLEKSEERLGSMITMHVDRMMETLTDQFVMKFAAAEQNFMKKTDACENAAEGAERVAAEASISVNRQSKALNNTLKEYDTIRGDMAKTIEVLTPLAPRTRFFVALCIWIVILGYILHCVVTGRTVHELRTRNVY